MGVLFRDAWFDYHLSRCLRPGTCSFQPNICFSEPEVQPTRFRIIPTPPLGGADFCDDERWGCRLLVALPLMQDLLFCAKDLFFRAMMACACGGQRC
jgi:hypothetical protein